MLITTIVEKYIYIFLGLGKIKDSTDTEIINNRTPLIQSLLGFSSALKEYLRLEIIEQEEY